MKWTRKIQKLGRIQIPTEYLRAGGFTEGDIVLIEEQKKNQLSIRLQKNARAKKNEEKKIKTN